MPNIRCAAQKGLVPVTMPADRENTNTTTLTSTKLHSLDQCTNNSETKEIVDSVDSVSDYYSAQE